MTVASNKKNGGFFFTRLLSHEWDGGFCDTGDGVEEKKRKYGSTLTDEFLKESQAKTLKDDASVSTLRDRKSVV